MSYFDLQHEDGLLVIGLDHPEARVNTLSLAMLDEFRGVLDRLEQDADLKAAIIISRKKDSFIVGADIKEFADFTEKSEVVNLIHDGHALFNRLERSNKPVVAAIHGACVGGGLELAMACHYRLASEHGSTKFALPEVNLGLLPGLGGTQRLPRLVGLQKGLELILTGKNVYPKQARKLGLIDATIHPQGLEAAAKRAALGLVDGSISSKERKSSLMETVLEKTPLNNIVYSKAEETVSKRTRGNYPAPVRIIATLRTGMEKGMEAGLKAEAQAFADLVLTPASKALRHLFFAKNAAEKNDLKDEARSVATVGVLGAGLMGGGIAQISAQNGFDVLLKDQSLDYAAKGKGNIYKDLSKRVGKGLSEFERDRMMARVTPTESYALFEGVELTIEAVLETLELKQQVLNEVEAVAPEGHIFASNTSSIPIKSIAEAAKHPEAVLGMHYFSPVPKMPLLEIIKTDQTAAWALATATEVGLKQGKTVIVVGDSPGFYANRILAPYINEALVLLKEGASVDAIDEAMRDFGYPVGPLKLLDEVGLDVGAHVTEVMAPVFEARGFALEQPGHDLLAAGLKGRKGSKGFYLYEKAKSKEVNKEVYRFFGGDERKTVAKRDIQERLFLAMLNEAMFTLDEGVINAAKDGDVGAVFGIGFPPFLGGPFFYTDSQGPGALLERLRKLHEAHGVRFQPSALLKRQAAENKRFYS